MFIELIYISGVIKSKIIPDELLTNDIKPAEIPSGRGYVTSADNS